MTIRTALRLAWLAFAALVVVIVFVPALYAQTMAICDNGWCMISEQALNLLIELAGKAGKWCA